MKKSLRYLACLLVILLLSYKAQSQIIHETMEANVWSAASNNGNNSGSSSGSIVAAVPAGTTTVVYYTNNNNSSTTYSTSTTRTGTATSTSTRFTSTLTTTGLNTSPYTGTWWYSRGRNTTDDALARVHSASQAWNIGGGGYLITPVIPAGITTVTFWMSPPGSFYVGANQATNSPMAPNFGTSASVTGNGYTSGLQTYVATAGNTSMQSFSYTSVFTSPVLLGFFNTNGSNAYIDDINISSTVGTAPSVITANPANPINRTTATVIGTIAPNTPAPSSPIAVSGIIWSTSNSPLDTSLSTKTNNGPGGGNTTSGTITGNLTGLTPGTLYYARAYAMSIAGIVYGNTIQFTTLPSVAPTVATVAATNVSSIKGTMNGNLSDSGGVSVTQSGFCWSTTAGNTQLTSPGVTITTDGAFGTYSSNLTNLNAGITYYYRAYATNSKGTSYGTEMSFTTLAAAPSILATPTTVAFGSVVFGATPPVSSYTLSARTLSTASGNIVVTAPAGFLVSLSPASGFASSINVPYTGSALTATQIYVQMQTNLYGVYGADITHSGGGATAANTQNVTVSGNITPSPDNYSSAGLEFWTGFGFIQGMSGSNNSSMSLYISATTQDAIVTIDIPGLPGAFSQTVTVPAGTVSEIGGFPKNATNPALDSRLYYTGISGRAIHVVSTNGVPISVWTYIYQSDNSATGSLNFPTNTWNSDYTVQSMAGPTNNSVPFPYFFVIAKEDNTKIRIIPSSDIIDSSKATLTTTYVPLETVKYPKNVPFEITLNKNQVFTGIAYIEDDNSNNNGTYDLSGTRISSIDCNKKIAVFGGNGRCLIGTSTHPVTSSNSGSDNLMQQMFPQSAWGTDYLSVPTKNMENNLYRVFVKDTATIVTVNGVALAKSTLIKNSFYELDQVNGILLNTPNKFSGNKPISVIQFITSQSTQDASVGNNGSGDPEMIILSAMKQAINNVTVYTPNLKNGGTPYGNYINVIIPKAGVSTFRMYSDTVGVKRADTSLYGVGLYDPTSPLKYKRFTDTSFVLVDTGANSFTAGSQFQSDLKLIPTDSAFKPHPQDPNYYYAKFKVEAFKQYTLTSSASFNAIAYGSNTGESYGFNAGTNIKNLSSTASIGVQNPYGPNQNSNATSLTTCKSVPFHFTTILAFKADSLRWNFNNNANITPNAPILQKGVALVVDSSKAIDANTTNYYYTLRDNTGKAIDFNFALVNSYPVIITAFSSTLLSNPVDPCAVGSDSVKYAPFNINVITGLTPDFKTNYTNCQSDTTIKFTDLTVDALGYKITGWRWEFGYNNRKDSVNQHPTTTYPVAGTYNVKLRAIDSIGCYADITKALTFAYKSNVKFGSVDTACVNSNVLFTDTSKAIGGTITQWRWNYGDGSAQEIRADSARRTHAFTPAAKYTVILTTTNAAGCVDSYSKAVNIMPQPLANYVLPVDMCFPNPTGTFTNSSTISDASVLTHVWDFGDATATSTATSPTHSYTGAGPYTVKLTTTSKYGCVSNSTQTVDNIYTIVTTLPFKEGFEGTTFPPVTTSTPAGTWHISQTPNDATTWQRITNAQGITAKEGTAAAWMRNFTYGTKKAVDDLNTPVFQFTPTIGIYDSLILKFDVAAKTSASLSSPVTPDTLEVLMSKDCGQTWRSIYKKFGSALQTVKDGSAATAGEFTVNNIAYWRTDSINITAIDGNLLTSGSPVRFKFRNTNNTENNIYLDNINLYDKIPNGKGLVILPNPSTGKFNVLFFTPPANLRGVGIYTMAGQLVKTIYYNNNAPNPMPIDLTMFANGMYLMKLEYSDKDRETYKLLKQD